MPDKKTQHIRGNGLAWGTRASPLPRPHPYIFLTLLNKTLEPDFTYMAFPFEKSKEATPVRRSGRFLSKGRKIRAYFIEAT